jgi:hypothetical protein
MSSPLFGIDFLWTVSSLFDFMSADSVVRLEFNLWMVSSVFMPVFICFVSEKEGAILHFVHYTLQIIILVSFGRLGCWLIYIGNSFLRNICFYMEFMYSLMIPCFNTICLVDTCFFVVIHFSI